MMPSESSEKVISYVSDYYTILLFNGRCKGIGLMFKEMRRWSAILVALSLLSITLMTMPLPSQASGDLAIINTPQDGQAGRYYQYVPQFNKEAVVTKNWTNAPFLSWDGEGFTGTPGFEEFGRYRISVYIESADGLETANKNETVEFDTHWNKNPLEDIPQVTNMSVAVGNDGVIHVAYTNSTGVLKHMRWSDGWSQPFSLEGKTGADPVGLNRIAMDSEGYPHIVYHNSTGIWYLEKNAQADDVSSWYLLPDSIGTSVAIGSVVSLKLDSSDNAHLYTHRSNNQDVFYLVRSGSDFNQVMTSSVPEGGDFALMPDDSPRFIFSTSTDPDTKTVNYGWLDNYFYFQSSVIFDSSNMLVGPKIVIHDGAPHIVFQENQSSEVRIHYGYLDGSDWEFEIVAGPDIGRLDSPQIQLDEDGNASVVFVRSSIPSGIYHATRASEGWELEVVESRHLAGYGQFCNFVLDGDDIPHAFYSRGGHVIHAHPSQWAPTFLNVPEDLYVGDQFEYQPQFDEPAVIVEKSTNAPFLTWDSSNDRFHGTPDEGQDGTYWINITAAAVFGGLTSTLNETFTVRPLFAPVLTPDGSYSSQVGQIGEEYRYRIQANGPVEWEWSSDAPFLTENWRSASTLDLISTPEFAGSFNVNISATSVEGLLTSYNNFTLTIIPRWAPEITSSPETSAQETIAYSYAVIVNETEVTWGGLQSNASFLEFSTSNQTIYGTPSLGDEGNYYVNISVTSDQGKEPTYQNYTLIVSEAWAPQISSDTSDVVVQATTVAYRTMEANESVTWSFEADADFITFNESYSTFIFSPSSHQVGDHHLDVTATSDGGKLPTTVRINVIVTGLWHPSIDPGPTWNGKEAFSYEQTLTANESVSWSYSDNLPSSLTVETNETVLKISGIPEVGDAGDYYINVTATSINGLLPHIHNWTFMLSAAYGPELISTPVTTATVGQEYDYWVQASVLTTYTFWTDAPFLSWNETEERISGTPGPDHVGQFTVNISATATDGGLSEWQNYTLTVSPQGLWAPTFGDAPDDAFASQPYAHSFVANESVTWFCDFNMDGDWTVVHNDTTLTLQGTPGTPGTYYFNLTATSQNGTLAHSENYTFVIIGLQVINAPGLSTVGAMYQFTPQFNMPVVFESAETDAPFLTWDGTSFSGEIPSGAAGAYWIKINVTSEDGNMHLERNWTFTVADSSGDSSLASLCSSVFVILAMGLIAIPMFIAPRRLR